MAEVNKVLCSDENTSPFNINEYRVVAKRVVTKKVSTIRPRWILRTNSIPPINTKGSRAVAPTHQLALWRGPSAVKATAIAAGLNICFLRIVKIYFDAIASHDAANKKVKLTN